MTKKVYKNLFKNERGYGIVGSRLLVERDFPQTKTAGGIILPDSSIEKATFATVVGVGYKENAEGFKIPLNVCVEDVVIIAKFAGMEVKVDGHDLCLINENDVMLIVEHDRASRRGI